MRYLLIAIGIIETLNAWSQKKAVDLLVYHARIYTVDAAFSTAEAMAVKDGKIEAVGSLKNITAQYETKKKLNAGGKYIFPGLIDAHAHFFGYAQGLQTANLVGTNSWDEIVNKLSAFAQTHHDGWLLGRGWDQNDWTIKEFPSKEKLDALFPDRPVLLQRVDGHAAIANQKALDIAGVKAGAAMNGGEIETKNGKLTGILVDNAVALVASKVPQPSVSQMTQLLLQAQQNCFAVGLTTVDDPGLNYRDILLIDSLQKTGGLKMRVYAMLSDAKENYQFAFTHGKIKTNYLNVRAFKVYADGALGSRGAALLQPYTDKPGWTGFLLSSISHFDSVANIINTLNFQMCTHAIGDSGNRVILNIYAKYLKGTNDKRWRIEHAQVINNADFHLFGENSIVPSVQPTHATSDMYWADKRLGKEREKGAYAYKQLLEENGWMPLGTDFPVEDISPIKTFYAAVFRQDVKGYPAGGFQMENALSRQQALHGMTIWVAKSNFEESEKGSLEKGKWADFVILDTDLMTAHQSLILKTNVMSTYIAGQPVYQNQNK